MYWVRISDMKINQEMKRKIVQVAAFGYSNTYNWKFRIRSEFTKEDGTVLQSRNETVIPVRLQDIACPIGAMQQSVVL